MKYKLIVPIQEFDTLKAHTYKNDVYIYVINLETKQYKKFNCYEYTVIQDFKSKSWNIHEYGGKTVLKIPCNNCIKETYNAIEK